jgi:hypothetical protein
MRCCRTCSERFRSSEVRPPEARGIHARATTALLSLLAAASVGLLCLPARVYGQGRDGPVDAPDSVSLRFGPLALAPTLTLTDLGWDSNVSLRSKETDAEGDVTAVARPEVTSWLRLGPARVRGRSRLDFVYFRDHSDQRSVDIYHGGRLEFPMAHITPYVSGAWIRSRERFGFEIDERTRRRQVGGTAGVALQLGLRTSVDVSLQRNRLEFDRSGVFRDPFVANLYDLTSAGFALTVREQVTPYTAVAVTVDRRQDRFDQAGRDSDSLGVFSGVEFSSLAAITGSAYVGWYRLHLRAPGSPSFGALSASVDLGYTLFGTTRFAVEAQREVFYSAARGQHAYLQAGARTSVTHRLNESWDVGARVGRHQLTYGLFGADVGSPFGAGREVVTQYGATVGFRLGPDTRLSFELGQDLRGSAVEAARLYKRTRVAMSINYQL